MNAPQREMPAYRCMKIVHALKIESIKPDQDDSCVLHFATSDYAPLWRDGQWTTRHRPEAGGYYVVYDTGHTSYSPAAAFEGGYVPMDEWGLRPEQSAKFKVNAMGRLANRETGRVIHDAEPVFILRAKDAQALAALGTYRAALGALGLTEQATSVDACIARFAAFQAAFPETVRNPT